MASDDKTRRLRITPDFIENKVTYDGQTAAVTITEFSPYGSKKSNKQVVLTLTTWDLKRFVETLGDMLRLQEESIERDRAFAARHLGVT